MGAAGGAWLPRNYDRRQHGPVRLRAALANSYNVPAVELTDALGPERVLEVLRQAGFSSLDASAEHYGAGLVLGNGDVSLWELARAYRGLARGGVVEPMRLVRSATDRLGAPVAARPELEPRRFLPSDAVALLTDVLSDETARAPAFGLDNALRLPFPVAAKTGTSRAYVDNWTVGFTRERTVAVWVGNFDGRPMQRVSGITGAGPLFARVMRRAMAGVRPAAAGRPGALRAGAHLPALRSPGGRGVPRARSRRCSSRAPRRTEPCDDAPARGRAAGPRAGRAGTPAGRSASGSRSPPATAAARGRRASSPRATGTSS